MSEWMKLHSEQQLKCSEQRSVVTVDTATRALLNDLGIEFKEVKVD